MNTPSPLVPQGTFQDKGKSHVRITVFAILAIHFVLLGVLLIAGCNKKSASETDLADNPVPPVATPTTPEQWPTPAPPPTGAADIPPVPPPVPPAVQTQATAPVITPSPIQSTPEPTAIAPNPIVEPVAGLVEHTITKGETLATIGKKYGVGYKAIEAANPGINPTRLKIGDKIKIPAKTATTTTALAAPNATDASAGKVYVVKSGDNLLKIAKATGVSVNQLRAANNLRTDQIRVGQKLKIPVKAAPAPAEAVSPPPVAPPVTPGVPQ
jgi:LysM repeat protein